MPRFFFNIYDGETYLDRDGVQLAGWAEARVEAIRLAGAVLKDDAKRIDLSETWRMEVATEAGLVLFRLDFNVLEGPATLTMLQAAPS